MLKRIAFLFFAIMLLLMLTSCQNSNNVEVNSTMVPIIKTAPPSLKPQPEIEDYANLIRYSVSKTISSDMVVQRNSYFNVFGWSKDEGGIIYGEFMGEKRYGVVNEEGEWSIQFSSHEATTQPQTLKVYPLNGKVTEFDNILIGDVWVIAGQSNAELHLADSLPKYPDYKKEINKEDKIRVFNQTREYVVSSMASKDYSAPQKDVVNNKWTWQETSLQNAYNCSALGYFFAKELSKKIDIPLGIVNTAAGGAVLHELMPQELASECGFTSSPCGQVSLFYNALMHPFSKNVITGMIFYQGESEANGGQYTKYAQNLSKTVDAYRNIWGEKFPFINVQLSTHLGDSLTAWYELPNMRAAQFDAYRQIENSYFVVSRDQGFQKGDHDWAHPYYKFELGKRAADIAASLYQVSDIEFSASPEPIDIKCEEDAITIKFRYVADGLELLTGSTLKGFSVLDSDGVDILAEAEIADKNTVRLKVSGEPEKVQYCMIPNGALNMANLGNSADYPAPAFELTIK